MFDYESEKGRPRGRIRSLPEIPETPYSRRIPARTTVISRTELAAEWARHAYINRPSPSEAMWWLFCNSPTIIFVGTLAVGAADATFDLGVAERMANVQVDEGAGPLQMIQEIVHEIGVEAGGAEK